jgi:uncharacterized protein (TIGR03437 family)
VDGQVGFAAGPTYDLATGLGSVDAFNLATKWKSGTSSTTTVTAVPATVDLSGTVKLSAAVQGGTKTPTGTVTFLVNDTSIGSAPLGTDGTASITVAANLAAGAPGPVTAAYSGDAVYEGSFGIASVKLNLPVSGSLVVPFISPNPIPQSGSGPTGTGQWTFTITLTEMAGVATKLTGITVDGANSSNLVASFNNGNIAAKGSVSATFVQTALTGIPVNSTFEFCGQDADGTKWNQQVTVTFTKGLGAVLTPTIKLTVTPGAMQQNLQAETSCQFSQTLTLDERSGYMMQLSQFTVGSTDLSAQISQLFGTTRLAPFGTLQAKMCFDGATAAPAARTYSIRASAENGAILTATGTATFQAAPATPAALSVAPANPVLAVADSKHDASAAVNITLGAPGTWRASIVPDNSTTAWLKATPLSGNASGPITLQASAAGLSNGAYRAMLAIEAPGANPQSIMLPVTFVVGAGTAKIAAATNAASFQSVYAPGMLMSVFGSGLTSTLSQARVLPLPYDMAGVSATVNGISAPIVGTFPAANQINVQVPYEAGAGPALLAINNNGQVASFPIEIAPAAPGLFGLWDPAGRPAASAAPGAVLVAYITGDGDVTPTLFTGASPATGTSPNRLPKSRLPLTLTVGGIPATVLFSGVPTGVVGATQINFTVPPNVPAGPQPVVVTVGSVASQAVTLNVTAQ